jgi:hypothetical protein
MGDSGVIRRTFQQALDYLDPLFGPKKHTLDDLFLEGDWEDMQDDIDGKPDHAYGHEKFKRTGACGLVLLAGNNVGGNLLFEYNENKFEEHKDLTLFLCSVGASYSKYVFHASLCQQTCDKPNLKPIPKMLRAYVPKPGKRVSPELSNVALVGTIDSCGYVLSRHYGPNMLRTYARMSVNEAMKFIRESTPLEVLGG